MTRRSQTLSALIVACLTAVAYQAAAQQWPFEVTDLPDRATLTILVFGDAETGGPAQYRVGQAMFSVCERVASPRPAAVLLEDFWVCRADVGRYGACGDIRSQTVPPSARTVAQVLTRRLVHL